MTKQKQPPKETEARLGNLTLSRKEGWLRFVNTSARITPEPLTRRELEQLGDEAFDDYNRQRREWHANLGPINTPQMAALHEDLWDIVDSNVQDGDKAKGAVAIDAFPGLGKTTTGCDADPRQRARDDSGPETHSLLILPLFHVNGIVVSVLSPLLAGGRGTVAGRFDPRTFFGLVENYRPTYFSAVPTIYAMLQALPRDVEPDTSSLQFAICGAAPMPPGLITKFEARYGVQIIEGYGLSEATCASTTNPRNGVRKPGTVGIALPGQRVAIRAPDGSVVTDGSPGEVAIQGPTVMQGYLNQPEQTAETLVDGWLRTGDVGILDADGYLTLVDRAKDMIIRGGENIYPKEIEAALYGHPEIHEAAVVGRPDAVYGQVPVAFVALKPESSASVEQLAAHLEVSLAKYKRPKIIVVESIPKNAIGKIDKPTLRRQLGTPSTSIV